MEAVILAQAEKLKQDIEALEDAIDRRADHGLGFFEEAEKLQKKRDELRSITVFYSNLSA